MKLDSLYKLMHASSRRSKKDREGITKKMVLFNHISDMNINEKASDRNRENYPIIVDITRKFKI